MPLAPEETGQTCPQVADQPQSAPLRLTSATFVPFVSESAAPRAPPPGHTWHDRGVLIRFLATAIALGVATWLVPDITLATADMPKAVLTLLAVAVIFGLVNLLVKPIIKMFTGFIVMLTFGLFLIIINAVLLLLVSWLAAQLGLGWQVADLWAATLGSLIVSVVSFALSKLMGK